MFYANPERTTRLKAGDVFTCETGLFRAVRSKAGVGCGKCNFQDPLIDCKSLPGCQGVRDSQLHFYRVQIGDCLKSALGEVGIVSEIRQSSKGCSILVETDDESLQIREGEFTYVPYEDLTDHEQSVIDRLAQEFCPESIPQERWDNWAKSQVVSDVKVEDVLPSLGLEFGGVGG